MKPDPTPQTPERSSFRQLALSILFVLGAFTVSALTLPAAERMSSVSADGLAAAIATPGVGDVPRPEPRVVHVQRTIDADALSPEDKLKRGLAELAILLARTAPR